MEGDRSQLEQNISGLGLQSAIEKIDVNNNSIVLTLDPSSWTGKHELISSNSGEGEQLTINDDGSWSLEITPPADVAVPGEVADAEISALLNEIYGDESWSTDSTKAAEAIALFDSTINEISSGAQNAISDPELLNALQLQIPEFQEAVDAEAEFTSAVETLQTAADSPLPMMISSRSIIPISGNALLNQFPDLASAGADAAATAELQAAFDQLAGGDINAVSNFELKDALSNQFPGLNNASNGASNEISLAVNELQQAVNQLENGGINSISNA